MSTLADSPTPPGRKRFGWHTGVYAAATVVLGATEAHALWANQHGGREDYQHRTITENVRWLAATDRDGQHAPMRRARRVALLSSVTWLALHLATNGEYV